MAKMTSQPQSFSQGLFSEDTVKTAAFGAKASTADGRTYRYCKAGATALVAGKVYDGPASVANHKNVTVAAAAAIGATSITVTLGATAATANQYADGVIVINDEAGQGFTYGIKSHPAADASAALVLTLHEDESVQEALTTSSQASLVANRYNGVIIHASAETGIPVGVAIKDITAASYGWVQTGGPVSCLSDATVGTIGSSVAASASTDGACTIGDGILAPIGYADQLMVSTEYNPITLTIDS